MKYLEDYLSEEKIDTLEAELKKIYDNEEFITCTLSALENDVEADLLLDFLKSNKLQSNERYKATLFQMQLEKKRR